MRCVCKDETEQTGRSSPIKMRICNLHFFAPIWMAQPIVHNFRRMSMADLKPREPGFISYKEGWYEWDGRGKQEEEAFAGHTMGCIRLMVTDNKGAWVPGGLRPGSWLWLFTHDPDIVFLIMHQNVSQVSLAKRASPQFVNHVQIFTSHLPMMD